MNVKPRDLGKFDVPLHMTSSVFAQICRSRSAACCAGRFHIQSFSFKYFGGLTASIMIGHAIQHGMCTSMRHPFVFVFWSAVWNRFEVCLDRRCETATRVVSRWILAKQCEWGFEQGEVDSVIQSELLACNSDHRLVSKRDYHPSLMVC